MTKNQPAPRIDWGACINEKAIENLSYEQLKRVNEILEPFAQKHVFTVTDGTHSAKAYKELNGRGVMTCDNYPEDGGGLVYWDYYSDVIEFVCEHNPQIDPAAAWITDADGNELYDD